MSTFIGQDKAQFMAKRVGEAIRNDKIINQLTCSVEDINAGLDFLKQFVDPAHETSRSNLTIYSEEEAYNKIKGVLLNDR